MNRYLYALDDSFAKVNYYLSQYWIDIQDPRTKHLPLVDIHPVFMILAMTYFYVLVTKTIPKYMENREPFVLKKTILTYNVFMAFGSLCFFVLSIKYTELRQLLNFVYPNDKTLTQVIREEIVIGNGLSISNLFKLD